MKNLYLGNHKKGEIEIIEEVEVFRNEFVTHYNDKVIFPNGTKGRYLRSVWNAPYGVMVIAIKEEKLLLIRNFRHEKRQWTWEIIKGFGEVDLLPSDCAKKELIEETGYTSDILIEYKKFPDNGLECTLYVAKCLKEISGGVKEDGEAISDVAFFSKESASELIRSEECIDPVTLFVLSEFIADKFN